jgi:hypothetical protein
MLAFQLLTNTSRWQWTYKWTHYRDILLTSRQALAYKVVWSNSKVTFIKRDIKVETIEERQLEIRRLT